MSLTNVQEVVLRDFVLWCANSNNKKHLKHSTSYAIKHTLEQNNLIFLNNQGELKNLFNNHEPFYVTNSEFKSMMHTLDIPVKDKSELNWEFAYTNKIKNHKYINLK